MSDPKDHHFIPQFLLRKFLIPDLNPESLHVYYLQYGSTRKKVPRSIAKVEHLYSLIKEGEQPDTYFERQFRDHENIVAPIVNQIIKQRGGQGLDRTQKTEFGRFVGYTFARNPAFFEQMKQMKDFMINAAQLAEKGDFSLLEKIAARGKKSAQAMLEDFQKDVKKGMLTNKDFKENFEVEGMNRLGREIAERILNETSWFFFEAGQENFCIADDPVIMTSSKMDLRNGIGHLDTEIYFPISPKICFIAFRNPKKFPTRSVQQINELSVWNASRFVCSQTALEGLDSVLGQRKKVEALLPRDELMALYGEGLGVVQHRVIEISRKARRD